MPATATRNLDIPSKEEINLARTASRSMVTHIRKIGDAELLRLHFEGDDEPVEIPAVAIKKLNNILVEMAKGNAITIIPVSAELSTQDAANILNVSRPHLIKLLNRGDIPHHMAGTHRRVLASDLRDYANQRDANRHAALSELAAIAQEDGFGY